MTPDVVTSTVVGIKPGVLCSLTVVKSTHPTDAGGEVGSGGIEEGRRSGSARRRRDGTLIEHSRRCEHDDALGDRALGRRSEANALTTDESGRMTAVPVSSGPRP
jgi:hypothetical protein